MLERLRAHLASQLGDEYVGALTGAIETVLAGDDAELPALPGASGGGPPPRSKAEVATQAGGGHANGRGGDDDKEGDEEAEAESGGQGGATGGEGGGKTVRGLLGRGPAAATPTKGGRRGGASSERADKALMASQVHSTIRHLYDDKLKRDAVDELEHRPKLPLASFVVDWYAQRHGIREIATKHLANFREGLKNATSAGSRKTFIFGALAGYFPFDGDDSQRALLEPAALGFFLEFERKAVRASGETTERSVDGAPVWMPIDRAIELLRNEFRHTRTSDVARATAEIEELVRLPEEVAEIGGAAKARDASASSLAKPGGGSILVGDGGAKAGSGAVGSAITAILHDRQGAELLSARSEEDKERLLRRREEALVQANPPQPSTALHSPPPPATAPPRPSTGVFR